MSWRRLLSDDDRLQRGATIICSVERQSFWILEQRAGLFLWRPFDDEFYKDVKPDFFRRAASVLATFDGFRWVLTAFDKFWKRRKTGLFDAKIGLFRQVLLTNDRCGWWRAGPFWKCTFDEFRWLPMSFDGFLQQKSDFRRRSFVFKVQIESRVGSHEENFKLPTPC